LVAGESFDSFLQNNQDKTVLVKFFTDWCGPCKTLQESIRKLLAELERMKEKENDLVVLEIDAEKFPELARRPEFNVCSVPVLFLFREGKMLKKSGGSLSVPQLREFLVGGVVQLVERRPSDPTVVGSSPAASAKLCPNADGNQVKIKGETEAELEVRVVDKNGDKIKRYLDIKLGEHKVLITMKFQDERSITVKKRDEFEKAKKQAHKNLLKQKFGSDIDKKQDMAETEDMKYTILDDGKGDYKVNENKKRSQQYQTVSTSSQNISNSSCSNCSPFYTGALASEISVGAVEKFRQRAQKVKVFRKGKNFSVLVTSELMETRN
ncbi:2971_t:CDS:2, partial [Ambispora gerdemannii]